MKKVYSVILNLLVATYLVGCATVVNGHNQGVAISSSPTNAIISVDGIILGKAPLVAALSRKSVHTIKLELDGFQPSEITLTKSLSGWFWGNFLLTGGFIIGFGIDALSGGLYNLEPEQIYADLAKSTAGTFTKDGLYISVVLKPNPDWKKIGEMNKVSQ